MRVPAIAWWPGTIKPNVISRAVATTMDLFPTILNMAKAALPTDRPIDGNDITGLLTGKTDKVTDIVYYNADKLFALRKGPWKANFATHASYSKEEPKVQTPPLLYNLEADPSEKFDVAKDHADIMADLQQVFDHQNRTVKIAPPECDKIVEKKIAAGPSSK